MQKKESRLSLNKIKSKMADENLSNKSKMADGNLSDDDIPSNQEGNYAKDMDLDLTLKSSDEKSERTAQFDQDSTANECIDTVKQLMVERHEIAKAKESITYGLQSSKYPPWMTSQLHCKLNLVTSEDQDKFDIFWSDVTNNTIRSLATKASDYLSNEIKQKENKMQSCRHIALKALGVVTKGAAATKKNIDDKIQT